MKIHNNQNYLKSLGPTEAEIQASMKADQKRKSVNLESEATEKIKKFEDQVINAKNHSQNNSDTPPQWTANKKNPTENSNDANPNDSDKKDPPPSSASHIDIKV